MARPLSVLVVVPPTAGGGLERSTSLLLHGFDRGVMKPTVVLTHTATQSARLIETLPADVEVVELGKRGFVDQWRVVTDLGAIYDERRPDAVIGRATWASAIALLARRRSGHRPVVIPTEHVTPDLARQPRNLWLLLLSRRLFPRADAMVAVGEGVARAVQDAFRIPAARMHIIENAYDAETDLILAGGGPIGAGFEGDEPVVLFVGRLSNEKGVDDLIRAMALVNESVPTRLVVIGDGPMRAELEALARTEGIAERTAFAGYVRQPFRQMAAATVTAIPSHFEAFSVVILEAMRSGAAVVAADCDWSPREVIEDGRNGLLVPVADPTALAGAILRVLGDPSLAERLRREARLSSERYSPQRNIDAYQSLITELVARRAKLRNESP
ncbi:MAG TPA: glycosyltransferase [Candidatus Limnocylindrales bacterium]|nr:glycosyltransferase [Candidatus Limnocylindrales bacterium]